MGIDIIVPVWNNPVATRDCLVSLINHSPDSRIILVDNGSDRETEKLLEEFAEILDHRALLMRTDLNEGVIRAVNRGLARAEADYILVVRNTSLVTEGWLDPLLEFAHSRPEAGIMVPRLIRCDDRKVRSGKRRPAGEMEVSHGSLAALFIRKETYDTVGGLDEEMDGGLWCLKDYSRRAYRQGFLTFAVAGGTVYFSDEAPLGSAARREEALRRSITRFTEQWGEERPFCVYIPKDADLGILRQKLEVMLKGARQGHRFTVITHPALYRETVRTGCDRLHGNITIEPLPLLFSGGGVRKAFERQKEATPGVRAVTGIDGLPFPGVDEIITFAELERGINATEAERYGNGENP